MNCFTAFYIFSTTLQLCMYNNSINKAINTVGEAINWHINNEKETARAVMPLNLTRTRKVTEMVKMKSISKQD